MRSARAAPCRVGIAGASEEASPAGTTHISVSTGTETPRRCRRRPAPARGWSYLAPTTSTTCSGSTTSFPARIPDRGPADEHDVAVDRPRSRRSKARPRERGLGPDPRCGDAGGRERRRPRAVGEEAIDLPRAHLEEPHVDCEGGIDPAVLRSSSYGATSSCAGGEDAVLRRRRGCRAMDGRLARWRPAIPGAADTASSSASRLVGGFGVTVTEPPESRSTPRSRRPQPPQ